MWMMEKGDVLVEDDHEFEGGFVVQVVGDYVESVLDQHDELVCSRKGGEPFHDAVEALRRTK